MPFNPGLAGAKFFLILVVLSPDFSFFENTLDPDQLASNEDI